MEEISGDGEDVGIDFVALDDGVRIKTEEEAGGGPRPEAEYGDGSRREDWRESGEDVVVGLGEAFEGVVGDNAVDVSGFVQEEHGGAGERMWSRRSRDSEDADEVVG